MISSTGCTTDVDCSKYYVVHHNNHYSICYKKVININGDDEKYYQANDNKLIGIICTKGNNFDYNYSNHSLSNDFLCTKQILKLTDVIKNKELNQNTFDKLTDSDVIKSAVDSYYYSCEYEKNFRLDYTDITTDLSVFKINGEFIIGYDLTPNKSNKYIYDINSFDVLKFNSDSKVKKYNINSSKEKLSYLECQENLEMIKQKVMKK